MDIEEQILNFIQKKGEVRVIDIVNKTGFSRAYVHRFFKKLLEEGKIFRVGKANQTRYVLAEPKRVQQELGEVQATLRKLKNINLAEDIELEKIKQQTGIFQELNENISTILDYAFTEMLNNAIEHSQAEEIIVQFKKEEDVVTFEVTDNGVGIFKHIQKKKNLKTELEAIQDVLKGKLTTAPARHSGEGIFFTSKIADIFIIESGNKKITFNNRLDDVFLEDHRNRTGTRIKFTIHRSTKKTLESIFREYTGKEFEFSKTKIVVHLYRGGEQYISRSQARRILVGLEKFKTIILDFQGVKTVGQGFTDEIFRVWLQKHPTKKIEYKNENENIRFLIERSIRK